MAASVLSFSSTALAHRSPKRSTAAGGRNQRGSPADPLGLTEDAVDQTLDAELWNPL